MFGFLFIFKTFLSLFLLYATALCTMTVGPMEFYYFFRTDNIEIYPDNLGCEMTTGFTFKIDKGQNAVVRCCTECVVNKGCIGVHHEILSPTSAGCGICVAKAGWKINMSYPPRGDNITHIIHDLRSRTVPGISCNAFLYPYLHGVMMVCMNKVDYPSAVAACDTMGGKIGIVDSAAKQKALEENMIKMAVEMGDNDFCVMKTFQHKKIPSTLGTASTKTFRMCQLFYDNDNIQRMYRPSPNRCYQSTTTTVQEKYLVDDQDSYTFIRYCGRTQNGLQSSQHPNFWIGCSNSNPTKTWKWANGYQLGYKNLYFGEALSGQDQALYVSLGLQWKLHDKTFVANYICTF